MINNVDFVNILHEARMRQGTPLHRANLGEPYDVIIIGSGIGGLCCASLLSKAGKRVLVLEQHYTAGGMTHSYQRKGYEWDVGVHYIGDVQCKPSVMRRIFDEISEDRIGWAPMNKVYDRIFLGDDSYDLVTGKKELIAKLKEYFPQDRHAIDRYFHLIKQSSKASSTFFIEKTLPRWISKIMGPLLRKKYLKLANRTTEEVLSDLTNNKRLISVLTGQWGDYGLPPNISSFAMHATVANHYFKGASYPIGGASSIAKGILPTIEKYGGNVITNAKVKEIVVRKNQAVGVKIENGTILKADKIISGIGLDLTYNHLLKPKNVSRQKQIPQFQKPSIGHIGIYIGLKQSAKNLGLDTTNLWVYPDENHNEHVEKNRVDSSLTLPVVYISFPSAKDPEWEKQNPNSSTIAMVIPAHYSWFESWQHKPWMKRGEDYEKKKEQIARRSLDILYQKVPKVKGHIDYYEVSTPLSTKTFSQYSRGETYGLEHSPERFKDKNIRVETPVKNLYLTGQDLVTCGVGGGLVAGVLTSIRVLGPLKSRKLVRLLMPKKSRRNLLKL